MWFNYLNGAFRAGRLTTDAWSPNNSGTGSIAFGYNTIASGNYSLAVNHESKAIGVSSFASGFASEALGNYSVALGLFTKAGARSSIALGQYNIGNGNPTAQISTDPILEIGNGINSANRANALTILKNGKMGLQVSNPSDRLHVQADSDEDGMRVQIGTATKFRIFSNGSISMGNNNSNISDNDVYISNDLGIGVNAPSERLHISGAIKLGPSRNNESGTIRFQSNDLQGNVGGEWKSLTRGEVVNGNIDALTVNGPLKIDDLNSDTLFSVKHDNVEQFSIRDDGDIYMNGKIGFNINFPTYRLQLPNDISTVRGRGLAYTWSTYSDQRVKKNIKTITYGLEEILKLNPVQYDHHTSNFSDEVLILEDEYSEDVGFIAQEVHAIIKEIVDKPENENTALWSLNYEKLTPVLVKSIQEQQKIIEELRKEQNQMKKELQELKEMFESQ